MQRRSTQDSEEEPPSLHLLMLLLGRRRPSEVMRERGAEAWDDPAWISAFRDLSVHARDELEPPWESGDSQTWIRDDDRSVVEAARREVKATCRALMDWNKIPKRTKATHRIGWRVEALRSAGKSRKEAEVAAAREFGVDTGAARGAYTRYRQRKI